MATVEDALRALAARRAECLRKIEEIQKEIDRLESEPSLEVQRQLAESFLANHER